MEVWSIRSQPGTVAQDGGVQCWWLFIVMHNTCSRPGVPLWGSTASLRSFWWPPVSCVFWALDNLLRNIFCVEENQSQFLELATKDLDWSRWCHSFWLPQRPLPCIFFFCSEVSSQFIGLFPRLLYRRRGEKADSFRVLSDQFTNLL